MGPVFLCFIGVKAVYKSRYHCVSMKVTIDLAFGRAVHVPLRSR